MPRTIWKYQNVIGAVTTGPRNGRVVHVAEDPLGNQVICFWIEWEIEEAGYVGPFSRSRFQAFATGAMIPDSALHRGTAVFRDGHVWHLYELQ